MSSTRQLWIVDDDLSFCDFLRQTLANQTDYHIAGMSHTLNDAKYQLAQHQPDLVTVDLSLPDGSGVELVRWLQQHYPDCKKMVVSLWGNDDLVFRAFQYGADGFLQKDKLIGMEITAAICALEDGGTPISPKIAKRLLGHFQMIQTEHAAPIEDCQLSDREREVLQLLAKGLLYKEIADLLNLSPHTVASHVKRIYKKINVASRGEAVFEAQKRHLL
ncbi:MAG: response regulator transcription factor [Moraxellaceae bacterium]